MHMRNIAIDSRLEVLRMFILKAVFAAKWLNQRATKALMCWQCVSLTQSVFAMPCSKKYSPIAGVYSHYKCGINDYNKVSILRVIQ